MKGRYRIFSAAESRGEIGFPSKVGAHIFEDIASFHRVICPEISRVIKVVIIYPRLGNYKLGFSRTVESFFGGVMLVLIVVKESSWLDTISPNLPDALHFFNE